LKVQSSHWAFVPARGSSKAILKKNLALLDGKPLLDYGIKAALESKKFNRIICSTDDYEIENRALSLGIEVDKRPAELATDDASVANVAREWLRRQNFLPDILALVQPTSPFLLSKHVHDLMDAMESNPSVNSGQTICLIPHNFHAWNQRLVEDSMVRFMFITERRLAYNKQRKPKLYSFGNLVAIRPEALLAGLDFFAEPSLGIHIEWPYNLDVDRPDDLRLAEVILQAGLARLDHML
jgi:CMP-N-acetylneuraminic acid synthetase